MQRNRGVTVMFDDVLKGAKKARGSDKSNDRPKSKNNQAEKVKSTATKTIEDEVVANSIPKKRNKSGKRTDPAYKQVGAYVKKDTYLQIQRLLLEQPDLDFSDLVQELLSTYLDNQLTD